MTAVEGTPTTVFVGRSSVLGNDDVKVYDVERGILKHSLPGHYRGVTCIGRLSLLFVPIIACLTGLVVQSLARIPVETHSECGKLFIDLRALELILCA